MTTKAMKKVRLVWPLRVTILSDRCDGCGCAAPSALCDRCAAPFEAAVRLVRGAA